MYRMLVICFFGLSTLLSTSLAAAQIRCTQSNAPIIDPCFSGQWRDVRRTVAARRNGGHGRVVCRLVAGDEVFLSHQACQGGWCKANVDQATGPVYIPGWVLAGGRCAFF